MTVDSISLELLLNLANTYKAEGEYNLAEENYKKILEINPKFVLAILNYGNLKNDLNMADESISLYDEALEIDNNNFTTHFNKAFMLQATGKFVDAIFHAKKSLELNKNFAPADALLAKMLNYKDNLWHLESMIEKVKDQTLSVPNLYNLHFAIGNVYEQIGKTNLSIKHIIQGNEIKRKNLKYDIKDDIKIFELIKNTFKDLDLNSLQNKRSDDSKNLIFILGMPRSGTTLVEQIISTHSNVFGAGELFILANIIKDNFFSIDKNKKKLDAMSVKNTNFKEWEKQYNNYLLNFQLREKFLTDKNPLNFLWIGFIKIVFS